jgi:hypothetical protein
MAFTRVHYKAIARIIAESSAQVDTFDGDLATGSTQHIDKAELVSELSKLFQKDNERFDEGRFIEACYP